MPAYEQITVYFLKDLINGRKKSIKGKDCRWIQIPQYEGLSLDDISKFLQNGHQHVFNFMPDSQEIHKVPKQ